MIAARPHPRRDRRRRDRFGAIVLLALGWATAALPGAAGAQESHTSPVEVLIEFRWVPEGWWAVGGAAAVIAAVWLVFRMYRREGRSVASRSTRLFLAALRCAVLVLLVAVLLEPVRVEVLRRWVESHTLVLVDASSSMDLTESYRDPEERARVARALGVNEGDPVRRAELAAGVLGGPTQALLHQLALRNSVKLYEFDREARPVANLPANREGAPSPQFTTPGANDPGGDPNSTKDPSTTDLTLRAGGPATNLDRALRRAVEAVGGAPVSGVVVISDGGLNEGASAEEIARFARERNLALYTVAVGDPAEPRNVRVVEVEAPSNVLQKDPFNLDARLAFEGVAGEHLSVRLIERDETEGTPPQVVEQRSVPVEENTSTVSLRFERRKVGVGRFTYQVEVEPLPGESLTDDNGAAATVNVVDTRTRVLLISGGPSWEYRYLSRLLMRDESFNVSCWLQSADVSAVRDGTIVIDHLPRYPEELFVYDVIVMLDPDPREFDNEWSRLVDRLVSEHGGGLLVQTGRTFAPAFLREADLRPLHDLLPVVLDPEADLVINQIGYYQEKAAPFLIPDGAAAHAAMHLADDPVASRLTWQQIGEVYWHYPTLHEKPVATVLVRHGDPRMRNAFGPHVLAAVQYVGAGRTGLLAFDSTWRWRQFGQEYHERFWVQMLRFLAEGRLAGGSRRAILLTDVDVVSLGDAVDVKARLLNERFEPLNRDRLTAEYEIDGRRQSFVLEPQADRAGWYQGRFIPQQVGVCRVRLVLTDGPGGEPIEAARDVRVSRPNLEMRRPQADPGTMRLLAAQSAGGRYFPVDEAAAVVEAIPDLHEEVPVRSRPQALWDRGGLLAVIVGLLALEWAIRKWHQML